ncbi:MAG: tRNA threonylcarbamoyladenosine dehydratase [Fusobacteria bacterium]|nr:tRNA threonylcarbamoyladenosine dehydratase [Fusobacteriota bacterium]
MNTFTSRTKLLLGSYKTTKLEKSHVAIFGIGGVGSFVVEALVRAGVGNITIVDKDVVDITNINRQIIATHSTIGKVKVDIMRERAIDINPNINIFSHNIFFNENTKHLFFNDKKYDYIVDAIDSVKSKLLLIELSYENHIPIISSMGMGNKIDPNKIEVSDISKTSVCPLARVVRKYCKDNRIYKLKTVYSKEESIKNESNLIGSISFVPSVAGLIIASEVVKDIIK